MTGRRALGMRLRASAGVRTHRVTSYRREAVLLRPDLRGAMPAKFGGATAGTIGPDPHCATEDIWVEDRAKAVRRSPVKSGPFRCLAAAARADTRRRSIRSRVNAFRSGPRLQLEGDGRSGASHFLTTSASVRCSTNCGRTRATTTPSLAGIICMPVMQTPHHSHPAERPQTAQTPVGVTRLYAAARCDSTTARARSTAT